LSSGIRIALRKRNEISQKEGSSENRIVLFVLVLILICCDFFVCPFPHNFFGSIDPNTDKIYIQNMRIKLARRNVFFSDRIAM
jgi:hypothetical protein